MDYGDAVDLQAAIADQLIAGIGPEVLLLLEHPPVITLGRGTREGSVLAGRLELDRLGVQVVEVARGGEATYHGPGQLVGYPILDLKRRGRDVHAYLRLLEDAIMAVVSAAGLAVRRFPPHTGVWVADEKVAAIGVHISRWVTRHGFALNVQPNLSHFDLIVPCGIREFGVTSMSALTGRAFHMQEIASRMAKSCLDVLGHLSPSDDLSGAEVPAEAKRWKFDGRGDGAWES